MAGTTVRGRLTWQTATVDAVVDEICEAILRAAAGTEENRPRIARLGSAQAAE